MERRSEHVPLHFPIRCSFAVLRICELRVCEFRASAHSLSVNHVVSVANPSAKQNLHCTERSEAQVSRFLLEPRLLRSLRSLAMTKCFFWRFC